MQVKPFTYDSIWQCKFNPLLVFGLSMTYNFNETDDPPEATGIFFQHSTIVKQWHGFSVYGTLTGKGIRYLYLQCFRNFLNFHLGLDLEFILKLFLAINISDLFNCLCIILALPTLVSVVSLKVDTVFPFPRLWQHILQVLLY